MKVEGLAHMGELYNRYVCDYKEYLRMRGYQDHIHDWHFVKRGFLACWLQPGFHRFWQIWNPGIGYFAYRLYTAFGGRDRQAAATLGTFFISGLVHNLVVSLVLWRWDFPLPFTFFSFAVLTIFFRWLENRVDLEKWPWFCHLAINAGLVILSFEFGFRMNDLLRSMLSYG